MDCNFNVRTFYITLAIIWSITVVAFLLKLFLPLGKAPTGTARTCLILTMTSAFFSLVEAILFLCKVPFYDSLADRTDANHSLSYIGTIFLSVALTLWAGLWCDVAGALAGHRSGHDTSTKHAASQLSIVRRGYAAVAIWHVPICVLRAATEFDVGLGFWESTLVWTVWLFISACCVFTVFAVQMWLFVAKHLHNVRDTQKVQGLRLVTLVNLVEQMVYNFFLAAVGVLYFPEHSNHFGNVQLAYFALLFGLYWMIHAQVLFFFLVVKSDDPMHSKTELEMLMLSSNVEEESASKDAENPVVMGSPTSKDVPTPVAFVPPQFTGDSQDDWSESHL